MFSASAKY